MDMPMTFIPAIQGRLDKFMRTAQSGYLIFCELIEAVWLCVIAIPNFGC